MIRFSFTSGRALRGAALLIGIGAVACGPEAAPEEEAAAPAAAPAAAQPLPPGGLEVWVTDVAVAADSIVTLSGTDLKSAQQRAMQLYIDRQEVIEQQYGPDGKLGAPEAVGEAVMESERRFHRLLALVNAPDTAAIAAQIGVVVDSLKVQHQEVVKLATEAGLPLDPRQANGS